MVVCLLKVPQLLYIIHHILSGEYLEMCFSKTFLRRCRRSGGCSSWLGLSVWPWLIISAGGYDDPCCCTTALNTGSMQTPRRLFLMRGYRSHRRWCKIYIIALYAHAQGMVTVRWFYFTLYAQQEGSPCDYFSHWDASSAMHKRKSSLMFLNGNMKLYVQHL